MTSLYQLLVDLEAYFNVPETDPPQSFKEAWDRVVPLAERYALIEQDMIGEFEGVRPGPVSTETEARYLMDY